jgi:hypothetical protein|tara:strand:- start:303 stop:431 length:129 start_codon:yes stop_codon:yes gene_type:complete
MRVKPLKRLKTLILIIMALTFDKGRSRTLLGVVFTARRMSVS